MRGPRAAVAGCRTGAAERLVHEAADGARAAAALGAAAETAIDPAGRPPPLRLDGGADVLIAQHIARTDDHGVVLAVERCSSLYLATARGVVRKLMASRL